MVLTGKGKGMVLTGKGKGMVLTGKGKGMVLTGKGKGMVLTGKGKDKDHRGTDHKSTEEKYRYSSAPSFTSTLDVVNGQRHSPAALHPPEPPGTHCMGDWVGHRAGPDGCGKSRLPIGILRCFLVLYICFCVLCFVCFCTVLFIVSVLYTAVSFPFLCKSTDRCHRV